jgi:hypothetical protein
VAPGGVLEEGLQRALAVALADADLGGLVGAHQREVFGQRHQAGALGGGLADQPVGLGQVGVHVGAGDHLHGGNAAKLGAVHGASLDSGYFVGAATGTAASFSTLGRTSCRSRRIRS